MTTKNELLAGLSGIVVTPTTRTPTTRTPTTAKLEATADKLVDVMTQIAHDPDATQRFGAALALMGDRDQEFAVTCFTLV